jgi:hypothetical protein
MSKIGQKSATQLTAPNTATEAFNVGSKKPASAEFLVTVASINTNVVVQPQYSDDEFATVKAKGQPETIVANGVVAIPASVNYKDARLYFVSESGGTAATIDVAFAQFTN